MWHDERQFTGGALFPVCRSGALHAGHTVNKMPGQQLRCLRQRHDQHVLGWASCRGRWVLFIIMFLYLVFFPGCSAVTQVVALFTRAKNGHRLCGVGKFPLLREHLEQHGVTFITERTQMRTTSSTWGCWWIKVVRVCSQGGSGSTRPAQNLDSTRALIHPTSRSAASLLCVYSKHHLFS